MSNPTELSYSIIGKGTPIVFLHGFCEDASMWDGVIEKGFDGYQVICIDLPGFGKSPIEQDFSIDQMADAVNGLLDKIISVPFYLFGHSMGGYVTLAYAEKYEEKLLGLGLINSHPFADSTTGKENRQKAVEFINKFGSTLFVKQLLPKLFPKSFRNSHRFLMERLVFDAAKCPARGISSGLTAMKNRPDRSEVLKNISIPFLAVVGKKDELLDTNKFMEQMSMANITQAELLPKLGHMSPFEDPKSINNIINSFLENFAV